MTVNALKALKIRPELVGDLKRMKDRQKEDVYIQQVVANPPQNMLVREEDHVFYVKGKNDETWRLFLPVAMAQATLRCTHEQFGHIGSYKLFKHVSRFFYWRGMRRDVKAFTRSCDTCQRVKYLNLKMEGAYEFLKATKPNELVSVDFFGPLPRSTGGVQYLFVLQDVFSKLVTLYPIKRATTKVCLSKILSQYCEKVGKPEKILSDHGTQFTAVAWKQKLEEQGIKVLFSSIRHPQSNPVERTMREIGRILRTYCSDRHTRWARFVTYVEDCLNLTTHNSTEYIPYYLHYNKLPKEKIVELFPLLKDVPQNHEVHIKSANENLQKAFDKRCKTQKTVSKVQLRIGDEVLLRVPHLSDAMQKQISKFFHVFEGPYKISEKIGENAYRLVSPEDENIVKGVYNRFNLRKYYRPATRIS